MLTTQTAACGRGDRCQDGHGDAESRDDQRGAFFLFDGDRGLGRGGRGGGVLRKDVGDHVVQVGVKAAGGGVEALAGGQGGGEGARGESVAGDQQGVGGLLPRLDALFVPRPLVFQPGGGDVLGLASVHQHDLGGGEGGEYVGLVFLAHLVPQAFSTEKHVVAPFGQMDVKLLGGNAVLGAVNTVCQIAVLVADEHVVGLFLGGLLHPLLANTLHVLGLAGVVDLGLLVGVGQGVLVIGIREHALNGGGVAGGDAATVKVLLILDAVAGHETAPVAGGVLGILAHDVVEGLLGLIELGQAKPLGGGVQEGDLLVGELLRLVGAAGAADPSTVSVFVIAAAIVADGLVHDPSRGKIFAEPAKPCSAISHDPNSFYHKTVDLSTGKRISG